jgi:hypothetical protein
VSSRGRLEVVDVALEDVLRELDLFLGGCAPSERPVSTTPRPGRELKDPAEVWDSLDQLHRRTVGEETFGRKGDALFVCDAKWEELPDYVKERTIIESSHFEFLRLGGQAPPRSGMIPPSEMETRWDQMSPEEQAETVKRGKRLIWPTLPEELREQLLAAPAGQVMRTGAFDPSLLLSTPVPPRKFKTFLKRGGLGLSAAVEALEFPEHGR